MPAHQPDRELTSLSVIDIDSGEVDVRYVELKGDDRWLSSDSTLLATSLNRQT